MPDNLRIGRQIKTFQEISVYHCTMLSHDGHKERYGIRRNGIDLKKVTLKILKLIFFFYGHRNGLIRLKLVICEGIRFFHQNLVFGSSYISGIGIVMPPFSLELPESLAFHYASQK